MKVQEYDKIRLNTDEIGTIVEKMSDTDFYAEVFLKKGGIDTMFITLSDIKSVFVETEHPISEYSQAR
ncbi:MAG: hypothetical protein LBM98_04790 [Oscillospiraceae bacterium]|jgi:hypothetical protein|nr:hypothetical protein [Oscillospiraceae bacterium]